MNPAALKLNPIPILVGLIGLVTAFVVGMFIGGGEVFNLALIFGTLLLVLIIAGMRQHIWLLLPMCWTLTGSVSILPIPFSVRDLVVMLVAAMAFALLALRIYRFRNKWGLLDFLMFLNLAQVALVFMAHPTGLKSLSSESVGARPYFNIAIAFIAYFIASNQALTANLARKLPAFVLIPEGITSLVTLMVRAKPSLGYVLGWIYTGFVPPRDAMFSSGPQIQRISIGTGSTLMTVLCSYFRPLSLLTPLNPFRFCLFLIGIFLVLISGFRSQLIGVAAIFVVASYFRGGLSDALTVVGGMLFALVAMVLFNASVHPLPLAIQRTLSFLPGHWDSRAMRDAEDSTDWRVQMWQEIPKSSRYIRDRVMGDGFGFSRAEMLAMERQMYRTGELSQEDSMIIGAFHNGPLSTMRYVGVVGFILYYSLLLYSAVFAARLIRQTQSTDFYPLAMFVGLPLVWEPINYIAIFGAYDSGLPNTIFAVGMLKVIQNSLRQSAARNSSKHQAAGSTATQRQAIRMPTLQDIRGNR